MMEKVSIIVPIYNVQNYLERCVRSLVEQTYVCIEIILVDDCSTDQSLGIAERFARENPEKCRVIRREKNGGLSAARNSGLRAATGEWLTFVDSDDWVTSDYVETLHRTASEEGADIVMSGFYYYYPSGKCIEVSTSGNLNTASSHREKVALCDPCATTRLFRSSLFFENGISFPEDIWRSEDIATSIPVITMTDRISIVKRPMYYYYQRAASLSNQNGKYSDVSFFPKTLLRMMELSRPGFEKELEFRAVTELLYGMVSVMLRSGKTPTELKEHIDWFNGRFPAWKENGYINRLPTGKRIFIWCASQKRYGLLRALIFGWDMKQKVFSREAGA
ncbi:MAG: glycosyltransferase family 2 protein [Christensenellales bacterium]|nr:glycosyltransferase family 2 protein [Christensenellales bacterium]